MEIQGLEHRTILQPYLDEGKVDYGKLADAEWLEDVVKEIQETDTKKLDTSEELAFWLNAYNVITLKAVLNKLEKKKDWEGLTSWWRKFKFFYWKRYKVGSQKISLHYLENNILREKFDEPRIHFAINCASIGCPYLPEGLFDGKTIDERLDQLTKEFINEQGGVRLEDDTLWISEIFDIYEVDFGGDGDILDFIQEYWEGTSIPDDITIKYQNYDWSLNGQ